MLWLGRDNVFGKGVPEAGSVNKKRGLEGSCGRIGDVELKVVCTLRRGVECSVKQEGGCMSDLSRSCNRV